MQSYSHIKMNHVSAIIKENISFIMAFTKKKIQHIQIKIMCKMYKEKAIKYTK